MQSSCKIQNQCTKSVALLYTNNKVTGRNKKSDSTYNLIKNNISRNKLKQGYERILKTTRY